MDRHTPDEINHMKVGELIHTMLVEFSRKDSEEYDGEVYMQSSVYLWAKERLDEIFASQAGV